MSRIEDPLGTAGVDLPPGRVFDPFSSSLTRLAFVHWARPAESVGITLYPPPVSAEASAEAWRSHIACGLPPGTALTRLLCGEGETLAAELHGPRRTRVAFVRGLRSAATVEHRGAPEGTLLPRALATLTLAPNRAASPANPLASAADHERAARAAFDANDVAAAITELRRGMRIAIDHWLASLVAAERSPNLQAAESAASILAGIGCFSRMPTPARDAEQIAIRVRRSLRVR